jgi:putative zinc finger/helix-turn-helix YgiT family protein
MECEKCGEAILDDRAMSIIEGARREALGLLSPEEIRAFRTKLQKTQGAMSEILGIGEKTYTRWESGSFIQSEAFDRYLRLLMDDTENLALLRRIVNAKKERVQSVKSAAASRVVFDQIDDVTRVEGIGRVFVDLLVRGALYVN